MTAVTWKAVPGWEGIYEVSDTGSVRSVDRMDSSGQRVSGRTLKPRLHSSGYLRANLSKANRTRDRFIHRLVLEVFVGPCPPQHEACHNDGNRTHNALSNLRWGTRLENSADRALHGTQPRGSKHWTVRRPELVNRGQLHPTAVLNSIDVERIRDLRVNGCTQKAIAAWIGTVTRECVARIDQGRSWRQPA